MVQASQVDFTLIVLLYLLYGKAWVVNLLLTPGSFTDTLANPTDTYTTNLTISNTANLKTMLSPFFKFC